MTTLLRPRQPPTLLRSTALTYMLEHQNQALTFLTHEIERLVCHQAKELHPSPDDLVWAVQFAYAIGLPPQQIVYALVEGEKKAFDTFKR